MINEYYFCALLLVISFKKPVGIIAKQVGSYEHPWFYSINIMKQQVMVNVQNICYQNLKLV